MINKFTIQKFNENGGLMKEKDVKSLKDIAEILNIEYHQARGLYLYCKNKTKAHPFLKELSNTYKIVDKKRLIADDLN